jgi:hypothetical protein
MLFEVVACERNGPRVADAGANVLIERLNDGFGGLKGINAHDLHISMRCGLNLQFAQAFGNSSFAHADDADNMSAGVQ